MADVCVCVCPQLCVRATVCAPLRAVLCESPTCASCDFDGIASVAASELLAALARAPWPPLVSFRLTPAFLFLFLFVNVLRVLLPLLSRCASLDHAACSIRTERACMAA